MRSSILLSSVICLSVTFPCLARIITVDDDGPADFTNIQAAIDISNNGDVIIVSQGTYKGPGNRDINFSGKAITVRSTDPNDSDIVAATIIDCNGTEAEPHRGFVFQSGEDANSVLDGVAIINGYANSDGAAIYVYGSSPTISHCVVTYCRGGGAVYIDGSNAEVIISSVEVKDNQGAGIYTHTGLVEISKSLISGNNGVGIDIYAGSVAAVKDCVIKGNSGSGVVFDGQARGEVADCLITENGGGVAGFMVGGGEVRISGCEISFNHEAGISGDHCRFAVSRCSIIGNKGTGWFRGGISIIGEGGSFTDCNIIGNESGGIWIRQFSGGSEVKNCRISQNKGDGINLRKSSGTSIFGCVLTENAGCGISLKEAYEIEVGNCTISGNQGSALERVIAGVDIRNSIFWGNNAPSGYEVFVGGDDVYGSTTISYTDVKGGISGVYIEPSPYGDPTLIWGPGNIDADPCFVVPGWWNDNGTPADSNDDFWNEGDYHLLAGSPCIDAGDNNVVTAGIETDLDGNPRFFDDPLTTDTGSGTPPIVDIGAYEYVLKVENITAGTYHRTIQDAIDAANNNDEIVVYPGRYTGSGNRDIDFSGKAITVRSTDPNDPEIVASTIIDCNGTEAEPHRGFIFQNGEDANSVLDGFTITNGNHFEGGAVYFGDSSATIRRCILRDNRADWGGAIYFEMLQINDPCILDCQIHRNNAGSGGGAFVSSWGPRPRFVNCKITENIAETYGGGVAVETEGTCDMHGCEISRNSAGLGGGGLFCGRDVHGEVKNSVITDNRASSGAGIMLDTAVGPDLSNCVISGNRAADDGGGIWWVDTIFEIKNSTITGNTASDGGGIYAFDGGAYVDHQVLSNCIISGNTAVNGAQLAFTSGFLGSMDDLSVNYCNIEGGQAGLYFVEPYDVNWGLGNIDADPCFVALGSWDANGTPADSNDDFWNEGDYHLLAGSPCIDAGYNNAVTMGIDTDLDGNPRFFDDPTTADTGSGTPPIVDIGAYEYILKVENATAGTYHRTIQDAVNAANNNDEIVVYPGRYTGSGNRDIDFDGKALSVRSVAPADPDVVDKTVIDCMGTVSEPHRGFALRSGESAQTKILGLNIINGYAPNELGAGQMYSAGGAIYCNGTSPTIENCLFSSNYSHYWGGAIYILNGNPVIKGCGFSNNEAFDVGGAVYANTSSTAISNCVFSGNLAGYGGAIYNMDSSPTVTNCTIAANRALSGGAIRNNRSTVDILNCILWGNIADSGSELYNSSSTVTVRYSNVQGGWAGTGNMNSDPCFADPAGGDYHLKSQAGCWNPSEHRWVSDDVSSPCIDAGNPASNWTDELWPHGKRVNMGAYGGTPQASMSQLSLGNLADLNNDGIVNLPDFAALAGYWCVHGTFLRPDFDHNCDVGINDLAVYADNWLWVD